MRISPIILFSFCTMIAACGRHNNTSTNEMNNDECLICGAPLQYQETTESLQCAICMKKEMSNARCVNGHFVCDACHSNGTDSIYALCLHEKSDNPTAILEKMMSMDFCHMHGPEHHILVGAALLTAYRNAGGDIDLESAIPEIIRRGKQVPGGVCGSWGACGASLSAGMFVSIITRNTPLSTQSWRLSNLMTSQALVQVANYGGPRCCKRDSYLSIETAVTFVAEHFGVTMSHHPVSCTRSDKNNQCIGTECPYFPSNNQGEL